MTPLPFIGAPALSALQEIKIKYLEDLTKYTKRELLKLHGVGPKAIRILTEEMKKLNLKFRDE